MREVLFWFRNDLRLHDNEAFIHACEIGTVLPVYVIDPEMFEATRFGYKKAEHFRVKFLLESLTDLRRNLQKLGSDLIVRTGKPDEVLAEIAEERDVLYVVCSKSVTQEETNREYELSQHLKRLNIDMELIWQSTLYHVRDMPFQIKFLPADFKTFKTILTKQVKIRTQQPQFGILKPVVDIDPGPIPTLEELGYEAQTASQNNFFVGGETTALQRLEDFVWKSEIVKGYKHTRKNLLGSDFSSKLSAWISLGCLSPKKVFAEVERYNKSTALKNEPASGIVTELLLRDYFQLIALKYGVRLFKRCGIKHDLNKTWREDIGEFQRWMDGQTGVPLVDACMRELRQTGYLSNKGRKLVSSFLINDLKLEWWWGAMYFESQLVDFDVCSNWGNWNYMAGLSNSPVAPPHYNIEQLVEKYDPEAAYIRFWLPELKEAPDHAQATTPKTKA